MADPLTVARDLGWQPPTGNRAMREAAAARWLQVQGVAGLGAAGLVQFRRIHVLESDARADAAGVHDFDRVPVNDRPDGVGRRRGPRGARAEAQGKDHRRPEPRQIPACCLQVAS